MPPKNNQPNLSDFNPLDLVRQKIDEFQSNRKVLVNKVPPKHVQPKGYSEMITGLQGSLPNLASGILTALDYPALATERKVSELGFPKTGALLGLGVSFITPSPGDELKAGKKAFQGFSDLTTKFLDYAKGKTTLSRQEIMDFARRPELKKGEADLLNRLGAEIKETKIPAQDFADSIRRDLLELKPVKVKPSYYRSYDANSGYPDVPASYPFENIRIKEGNPKNYEEVVFESPITTNGSSHFPNSKNYFAHARGDEVVEGGKKIWREQEIQSDLLQKDNLERISNEKYLKGYKDMQEREVFEGGLNKLSPFTNDRFGERIMRERIREKAQKGYSKYRLPTGETIGKIEGFSTPEWSFRDERLYSKKLTLDQMKVGMEVQQGAGNEFLQRHNLDDRGSWIITDILGDGRFKAVPKRNAVTLEKGAGEYYLIKNPDGSTERAIRGKEAAEEWAKEFMSSRAETFDLTGKSNPQYRRYENWGKFLKNKYGGKQVTDSQKNTWVEIELKPEYKKIPIEAFGVLPFLQPNKEERK